MLKKLLIAGALITIVLVGVLLYLATRFDAETLGRLVLARVNRSGAVEIQAARFSLRPFKGLQLEDAVASGELSSGRFTATVDSIELEHDIWSLFGGELVVRKIILERPRVELISGAASGSSGPSDPRDSNASTGGAPSAEAEGSSPARGLRLSIEKIHASDCDLLSRTEGVETPDLEIHGCTLELAEVAFDPTAPSAVTGLSATGAIRAQSVKLGGVEGRDANGRFTLADGQATITDLTLQTDSGRLVVEALEMNLTEEPPPYDLRLLGDLDVNHLLAYDGSGFGPGQLSFQGLGKSSETGSLRGQGRLRLGAGEIPPAALPLGIDAALQQQLLANVPYESTDIDFRIADERIELESFEIAAPGVKVGGAGTLDLAGALALRLYVRAPRAVLDIKQIPKEVLDGLEDDQGWVTIPLGVGGTFEAPRVGLDREALERVAVDRAKDRVEDEAKKLGDKLLKKLFGGDEDEG